MNLNSRDISRLVQRGVVPGHPNFAREVERVQRENRTAKNQDLRRRATHLTQGQGYELKKEWDDPLAWLRENPCRCPVVLGLVTKIERWERGNSPIRLVFHTHNQGSSAFEASPSLTHWRKLL